MPHPCASAGDPLGFVSPPRIEAKRCIFASLFVNSNRFWGTIKAKLHTVLDNALARPYNIHSYKPPISADIGRHTQWKCVKAEF